MVNYGYKVDLHLPNCAKTKIENSYLGRSAALGIHLGKLIYFNEDGNF